MKLIDLQESYSRSELDYYIDEFIFSERDRALLKRRLLDGILYEQLSAEFDLEPEYISRLVRNNITRLNDRIKRHEKVKNKSDK